MTLAELRRRLLAWAFPEPAPAKVALERLRWVIAADRAAAPVGYWKYVDRRREMYCLDYLFFLRHHGYKKAVRAYRWTVRR